MARVCVSCGLTTDAEGRLIVNTGDESWVYACSYENGVPIVCGADGVLRSALPEKFTIFESEDFNNGSGEITAATFGSPVIGGPNEDQSNPIVIVIDNPSDCLPMTIVAWPTVDHALVTKTGAGNSNVQIGAMLSVTGSIVSGPHDVHQHWSHSGSVSAITFDAMGSSRPYSFTLPAGGSATFTLTSYINVIAYNGSTSLDNWITRLDINGFN